MARATLNATDLNPPMDPCMCGSFDTWHDACYVGLSQPEIQRRHKEFVAQWRAQARAKALGHVRKVCKW